MSRDIRKSVVVFFAYAKTKAQIIDQLRGSRAADQRISCRYTDRTIPLLPKFELYSLLLSSVAVQPGF